MQTSILRTYRRYIITFTLLAAPLAAVLLIVDMSLAGDIAIDLSSADNLVWHFGLLVMLWVYGLPIALSCAVVMALLRLRRNLKDVVLSVPVSMIVIFISCIIAEWTLGEGHPSYRLVFTIVLQGGLAALLLAPLLPKAS
ncbi:MAG: hypothetical protein Q4G42_06540 [Neisseria sp.]|nr:hypothetical protein [Neisseria sp.]